MYSMIGGPSFILFWPLENDVSLFAVFVACHINRADLLLISYTFTPFGGVGGSMDIKYRIRMIYHNNKILN